MSSSRETHFSATGPHLSYGIIQCYLPPDTSERAAPQLQTVSGTRFTYTPERWKAELT